LIEEETEYKRKQGWFRSLMSALLQLLECFATSITAISEA